jgi:gluconokinase
MGVSGCGKSTIGTAIASALGIPFADGDDFHSESNRQKMSSGQSLTDADRTPWLSSIANHATQTLEQDKSLVVACSALKKSYRDQLRLVPFDVRFVHLHAPQSVIAARQANRPGHFMPAGLLTSQYQTLEPTDNEPDVLSLSVERDIDTTVESALEWLTYPSCSA